RTVASWSGTCWSERVRRFTGEHPMSLIRRILRGLLFCVLAASLTCLVESLAQAQELKLDATLWGWHKDFVLAVAHRPDGKILASGGQDGTVRLTDLGSGTVRFCLREHTAPVRAVRFAPDGKILASAGDDGNVLLWDMTSGKKQSVLKGHTGKINALAF